ncbi:xanthine dehydrogenase family protein subunit M [Sesbania bispinosa]|nr:xanthine dehydrogenase family protein subunit M [Sesbania bispinosa]
MDAFIERDGQAVVRSFTDSIIECDGQVVVRSISYIDDVYGLVPSPTAAHVSLRSESSLAWLNKSLGVEL